MVETTVSNEMDDVIQKRLSIISYYDTRKRKQNIKDYVHIW